MCRSLSVCIATGQILVGHVKPTSRPIPALYWITKNKDQLLTIYKRLNHYEYPAQHQSGQQADSQSRWPGLQRLGSGTREPHRLAHRFSRFRLVAVVAVCDLPHPNRSVELVSKVGNVTTIAQTRVLGLDQQTKELFDPRCLDG